VGWGDANLLKPFVTSKDLEKALSLYRKHHKTSLVRYSKLLPHAAMVLRNLKNDNYKLAVASNRPTKFSLILIRHLKLKDYFDYILCADKLKQGKPHPEILHQIMRKLLVRPEETLYVGDMVIDAKAGRAAGVRTVIVTTGSSHLTEIKKEKPYRVIHNISALLELV
jgi:phosphoglycolate phosphatase